MSNLNEPFGVALLVSSRKDAHDASLELPLVIEILLYTMWLEI